MARRRRRSDTDDNVPLDGPDHAWWAAGSIDPFAAPEPEAVPEPPAPGPEPEVGLDPYEVLRVAPNADWDEIVAAHRRLVRWWHPDGLGSASDDERDYSEARFRQVNEAYRELKVRKGR